MRRADYQNSLSHSPSDTTRIPRGYTGVASPWISYLWHWIRHLKYLHPSFPCDRAGLFSDRGSCPGLPRAPKWEHDHVSVERAKADEMKFMLVLCQCYCSSGRTDNTWFSRKPYGVIYKLFFFSHKSELGESVCMESALCITCLWHFGSNSKSLSARFTVSMNHNLSFCQTGQKQKGKALFQASMQYLETNPPTFGWERRIKSNNEADGIL